jgi:Cd(II)/Pb(II)-responsive transcriptional regulator
MKISELAKKANCDIETIRYYEKSGLLQEPHRLDNGYREYSERHQEQLQFIRHCRSLQMGLPEIRVLLGLKTNPSLGCEKVDELLEGHIARVREQIAQLEILESQLVNLRHQCQGVHSVGECGILQNLNEPADQHECACHEANPAIAKKSSGFR